MADLDIFSKRPTQTDIEDVNYMYYYPLVNPSGNNGPIEFFIPGNMLQYMDLKDTSLAISASVTNNGTNLTDTAEVGPVNNWLHSLFSDVTLTLNDTIVEGGTHLYPYKAYLTNLLLFGESAKRCQLQPSGWAKDQAGKMENVQNTGYVTRKAWIKKSAVYEMEGPLLLDMCMQGKLLLNQVDVRIKLLRTNNTFHLFSSGDNAVVGTVDIKKAVLKVKQVQVSADRMRQIESGLALQNAIYPIQRTEMYTYSIAQGVQSNIRENLFHNRRPKMLTLAMLPNTAFNGSYTTNPFRFPHYDLNSIGLFIDGRPIPHVPLTPDFEEDNYVDIYRNLHRLVNLLYRDGDIGITKNEFANGYTIFGYILAQDGKASGLAGQPLTHGNIRIELKFKRALTAAINVICMAVYDDEVQISRLRKVTVDYMA